MKKLFIILHLLFTVISITLAQPAMAHRNDLYVEILTRDGFEFPGGYHFPNDSSLLCPLGHMFFETNLGPSYLHTWQTSLESDNYDAYGINSCFFYARLDTSCYIKVTVGDNYGNTGTDSIYFNIYNFTLPDDFEMEIIEVNNELNAKISFTPGYDLWFFQAWLSQDSLNFVPYGEGWDHPGSEPLYPNNYFEYIFYNYDFNENSTWNIAARLYDTCGTNHVDILPGMYLFTENIDDNHFLKFKTSLQSGNHDEYVYTIFTVDSVGTRRPLIVDGEQVFLPSNTLNYELPEFYGHPYYQCAVAGVTDNGDYKILSYSNKVANPWNSTVNVGEYEDFNFKIYPNPANGMVTVETAYAPSLQGQMEYRINNVMGQSLLRGQISRRDTIDVSKSPQGLYFISIGDIVRKIVVE